MFILHGQVHNHRNLYPNHGWLDVIYEWLHQRGRLGLVKIRQPQ